MNRFLVFFIFMGGFISPAVAQGDLSESDYYAPVNLLRFADHLYDSGDYLRAAGEYQRYLFYSSQNSEQIFYRIAQCYQLGGQPEQAIHIFGRLLTANLNNPLSATIRYQIGHTYFLMGRYERSLSYLEDALQQTTDFKEQWRLKQLVGFNYLKQRRWSDAKSWFDSLATMAASEESAKQALQFKQYALKGEQFPHKSPFLAGALSTIVPGLGKVYSNRLQDGAFSFFTIVFFSWLAYDGFHDDGIRSVKGWWFAPMGGVFYLGNIYGSVIATRLHNRDMERDFLAEISFEIP